MWAEQCDPVPAGNLDQQLLLRGTILGLLTETRRQHDCRGYPGGCGIVQHAGYVRRGHGDDRQIRLRAGRGDVRIGAQSLDYIAPGVYRIDPSCEAAVDNVAQNTAADGIEPVGGTHNDNTVRLEQTMQVMFPHRGSSVPALKCIHARDTGE